MVIYRCPRADCQYSTEDLEPAQAIIFLQIHGSEHQNLVPAPRGNPAPAAQVVSSEKVKRPSVEPGITLERWNYFTSRWSRFKRLSNLDDAIVTAHLLECCDDELMLDLHRNNGDTLDTMNEENLLAEIKRLAVKGESQIISRVNLRRMCQDHQEDIRHYAARVKGQAALCNYIIRCPNCENHVSYADEEIKDQLCTGLSDPEIQKDVLACHDDKTTDELVTFIETRETGKRSQSALNTTAAVSKISAFRKSKNKPPESVGAKSADDKKAEACLYCGEFGHGKQAYRNIRQTECPAWNKKCTNC